MHNERETTRLRRMYDFVESKFRSLEALEVDQGTYATFVVPSLLEKLPSWFAPNHVDERRGASYVGHGEVFKEVW